MKADKGKRPFGRQRRRWEDNIKIKVRETELEGVERINLAPYRNQWS
jgi:hypothetical protein